MLTHNHTNIPQDKVELAAPSSEVNPGLVTKKTVASATSVSIRCVELWMQRKRIPYVRLSPRCVRFHLPSVLAALRRYEVKAVS